MRLQEVLYRELLPTLGPRILPALLRRLEAVAVGPDLFLLENVVEGVVTFPRDAVVPEALRLLRSDLPLVQRAGMKLLARHPAPEALDRLWEIHCALVANRRRFCRAHEHEIEPYQNSFDSLLACVRQQPMWLEGAIARADPSQHPVHDLAYLLGNLEDAVALWRRCKRLLFEKIAPQRERSLAVNIVQHHDSDEIEWLRSRVDRDQDLVGPTALRALARINPDIAVAELPRLPVHLLSPTKRSCFGEILRRRPDAARGYILRLLRQEPPVAQAITVYQENSGAVDAATLDALLDLLERVLDVELSRDTNDSSPLFYLLCQLLTSLNHIDHLEWMARRSKSLLAAKLTAWHLRRGPMTGPFGHPDRGLALAVLERLQSSGYTRVVNQSLNSTNQFTRIEGLRKAARWPDWQTVAHLLYLSQRDDLHEVGPVEQEYATTALAAIGEDAHVIASVLRWGRRVLGRARRLPRRVDDACMAAVFAVLEQGGEQLHGAILTLGIGGRSDRKEQIQAILQSAPPASETALACLIALRLLGDQAEESIPLFARQLEIPEHRYAAVAALLRVKKDGAFNVLLRHLEGAYDEGLAIQLLTEARTSKRAARLLRERLLSVSAPEKADLIEKLSHVVRDQKLLLSVLDDTAIRDFLYEAAFASERDLWIGSARPAIVRALARFDATAAFEAGRKLLVSPDTEQRERYPSLLVEINPVAAITCLLEQGCEEKTKGMRWAIGRALAAVPAFATLRLRRDLVRWLADSRPVHRRVACEVIGWLPALTGRLVAEVRGHLEDTDVRVSTAAGEALDRQENAEAAWEVLRALHREREWHRRWVLLDAVISLADPGDVHAAAPQWYEHARAMLPPAMRDYLAERVTKRRDELRQQATATS
jgi:hypothetical protein